MAHERRARYFAVHSSSGGVANFVDTYCLTDLVYEILVSLKQ